MFRTHRPTAGQSMQTSTSEEPMPTNVVRVATRLSSFGSAARWASALMLAVGILAPSPASAQSEVVEYYATDAVGSIRVVFDGATGQPKARSDYLPFGEALGTRVVFPRSDSLARSATVKQVSTTSTPEVSSSVLGDSAAWILPVVPRPHRSRGIATPMLETAHSCTLIPRERRPHPTCRAVRQSGTETRGVFSVTRRLLRGAAAITGGVVS